MHASPDSDEKIEEYLQDNQNIYSGKMYKYGDAYYGFISATHENISRIRMICFPVTLNFSVRRRWGIISSGASVDRLPVAGRILASKIEEVDRQTLGNPGRFQQDRLKLTVNEERFISNNIAQSPASLQDQDFILTVAITGFQELH